MVTLNDLETKLTDILEKRETVIEFLDRKKLDAVIIGKPDNFAWFTCGGNNKVVKAWDIGFSHLIITRKNNILISQIMDGPRVIDEELKGLKIEYEPLKWNDVSREEKISQIIKGMKVFSDIPINGATYSPREFSLLHYPFSALEIRRVRWLSQKTEEILRKVAEIINPGITEIEIAGIISGEMGKYGIECDVLLIGSDERIEKYRHPVPTEKKVKKLVLLHPASKKWGLHVPMSRMLSFGNPDIETVKKFDGACKIAAEAISSCTEGAKLIDILMAQEKTFMELGYKDEWGMHYHGGITGYLLVSQAVYTDKNSGISLNQPHAWFVTLTGVKVEELSLTTKNGIEICSTKGNWPTKEYESKRNIYKLPEILYR